MRTTKAKRDRLRSIYMHHEDVIAIIDDIDEAEAKAVAFEHVENVLSDDGALRAKIEPRLRDAIEQSTASLMMQLTAAEAALVEARRLHAADVARLRTMLTLAKGGEPCPNCGAPVFRSESFQFGSHMACGECGTSWKVK